MSAIVLDKYAHLFANEEAYMQFRSLLEKALRDDFSPVLAGDEVLGAFMSSEAAKEVIYDRIVKRISNQPDLLNELQDRLENDEIVDLSDLE